MTGPDPLVLAYGFVAERPLTEDVLAEVLDKLTQLAQMNMISDDDVVMVRRHLESSVGLLIQVGDGISEDEQLPWVEDAKSSLEWKYWESYRKHLITNGFTRDVLNVLEEDVDKILTGCGNPARTDNWRIKGLVMGDVQSGKTASYSGLVAKAADAGYKVIVLLTGVVEELRSQTQIRLDEGFVGRSSSDLLGGETRMVAIGAGKYRQSFPSVLTSKESDFLTRNQNALRGVPLENLNEPVLLVMKKNTSALRNFIKFVDSQMRQGNKTLPMPMLIVDDEADNASVNANKDETPTAINRLIRQIIEKFDRASYVAYTATPFANVFINSELDDELFPRDFVYAINAPSNYVGASSLFLEGGKYEDQVNTIADAEDIIPLRHKNHWPVDELPESLREAIRTFLLTCAIRDLRKEPLKHRTMLVNVSRFNTVQNAVTQLIKSELNILQENIRQYLASDTSWRNQQVLLELHETFEEQFPDVEFTWDEVRKGLHNSVASVIVVTVNQNADEAERLNYQRYKGSEKGRRVIAVGGLTLSRGLTLEGLSTSYFYRNSRAYDTLLQMGRWFGYRNHYDDLCRLWMSDEARDWFAKIATVVAELRSDLRRMSANNQKPSQFGIKVRSHPGTLMVTAANKMRNSDEVQVPVSFSAGLVETPFLPAGDVENTRNVEQTAAFIRELGVPQTEESRHVWRDVPAELVARYLSALKILPLNTEFMADPQTGSVPILDFIANNDFEELSEWDVLLAQGDADSTTLLNVQDQKIKPRKRLFEGVKAGTTKSIKVYKQRVGGAEDESAGMSLAEIEGAKREASGSGTRKTPSGRDYRQFRKRPLLIIHPIAPHSRSTDAKPAPTVLDAGDIESKLLIAVSLSFPTFSDDKASSVTYRLTKVAMREAGLLDDDEDNDEDED